MICDAFVMNTLGLLAFNVSVSTDDLRTFVHDDYEIIYNITNSLADITELH